MCDFEFDNFTLLVKCDIRNKKIKYERKKITYPRIEKQTKIKNRYNNKSERGIVCAEM